MNRSNPVAGLFGLLIILILAGLSSSQEIVPPKNGDPVLQNPIEVQTRGPLHEAFAQPFDPKAEPGPMIPKEPPPPIPEEPPDQKPEAENAEWIPGYWAWDAQRQEYLWVSGVYRVPPQGRNFIPGYWQNSTDGWRWISGFWSDANQQELPYTPEPPAPLDESPSMPAPDDASTYIPGSWVYRDTRFIWRAGYYAPVRPGRVWNPPHYVWTPRGYLFVDGYWDLPFEDRGLVFAPVYFNEPLWRDSSWRYRPSFVVGFDSFFDSCFVEVGRHHFYFGNYYDPFYARHGFHPWYAGRGRYDPVFAYHGAQHHRNNPNWIAGVQQTYANRSSGRSFAPPVNLAQQHAFVNAKKGSPVVVPLNQFKSNQVRLTKTTTTQIATQQTQVIRNREIAVNRQKLDAVPHSSEPRRTFQTSEARTLKLQTIVDSKNAGHTPRHETPRGLTTPNVAPKIETPRSVTSPNLTPRIEAPRSVTTPRIETPRIQTTPKVETPRIVTPPAPRIVPPPPAKKASVNVEPHRTVTHAPAATQQHRSVAAPATAPRIQSAPHVQSTPRAQQAPRIQSTSRPSPRVSAPQIRNAPARSNPPARSAPAPRPANHKKG
jgi:hypothetical protein